jgi:aconitate hydratase
MIRGYKNSFGALSTLKTKAGDVSYFRLSKLEEDGMADLSKLPFSIRILLESVLRNEDGHRVKADDVEALSRWSPASPGGREIPFMPARVLLQDFTGVPSVVDLAAMRDAMKRLGGDPKKINPHIPADLVIDHSVQVDRFGDPSALRFNEEKEFERNRERYTVLCWAQKSFRNFSVVPPATGIVHQVNLEYLARVVFRSEVDGRPTAYPDTLVGTDSHTPMVNGIGVLGWGVGGIEAEAVMLGEPCAMLPPPVVGFKLTGSLPEGKTATDLVLTVTQILRKKGVVGKFVEFFGPGLKGLTVADRATIGNMAPEYGATAGFFPVDEKTLEYLRLTGRSEDQVALVEAYCKAQGLFRTEGEPDPVFSETIELDLGTVETCLAGPKRPQDRVPLHTMKKSFSESMRTTYGRTDFHSHEDDPGGHHIIRWLGEGGAMLERAEQKKQASLPPPPSDLCEVEVRMDGETFKLAHGSVVIAAITSCTNTSNPSVMLGAGLLARKAVERGLKVKPWVKTSLAPGSTVVTKYLEEAGLMPALEALRFHVVGYGCTTCIGNSGPLAPPIADAIREKNLVAAAVLSGNRNFEGRINPLTRANYLASPLLVVAYALAGRMDIDFEKEPLGLAGDGRPVFLKEIWPTVEEIEKTVRSKVRPEMFRRQYSNVFEGSEYWKGLPVTQGELYPWDKESTYIKAPPFFKEMTLEAPPPEDIVEARVLAVLGDTVTTDHISPAGAIPEDGPAGRYLIGLGIGSESFNSFGSRRGNHEVMVRGTFGNIRLRNRLVPDSEGPWTMHFPSGRKMSIYEAAMRYRSERVPLLVIAGKEYGTGSSRDWAAKGTQLLGVRAVLAESFERIHRSNLVGMGVLPLQFKEGENASTLGLSGREVYEIRGIAGALTPGMTVAVKGRGEEAKSVDFEATVRLDSPVEIEYYRHGGILQSVIRKLV